MTKTFLPDTPVDRVQSAMALELVARLEPGEEVIARYGVTKAQLAKLLQSESFRTRVREAHQFWNSSANAKARIEAKAAMCVEDALAVLHAIAHDEDIAATTRIDAVSRLARIAGVDTPAQEAQGAGGGFRVNIYLGETPISVDTGLRSDVKSGIHETDAPVIEHRNPDHAEAH